MTRADISIEKQSGLLSRPQTWQNIT